MKMYLILKLVVTINKFLERNCELITFLLLIGSHSGGCYLIRRYL